MEEKHKFLTKLGSTYSQLLSNDCTSLFTKETDNKVEHKSNRPGLLVSSTSWTEDEDFSILFSALRGKYLMFLFLILYAFYDNSIYDGG